nr:glucose-6-phosphate 1-epimerase [Quercus suber]
MLNATEHQQSSPSLQIAGEVDRVYKSIKQDTTSIVEDGKPHLDIIRDNLEDSVVWNPWIEKSKGMGDFEPKDGYKQMVCVEVGSVNGWQKLEPGETFEGGQIVKSHLQTSKRIHVWNSSDDSKHDMKLIPLHSYVPTKSVVPLRPPVFHVLRLFVTCQLAAEICSNLSILHQHQRLVFSSFLPEQKSHFHHYTMSIPMTAGLADDEDQDNKTETNMEVMGVLVGRERQVFIVPEEVMNQRSTFFATVNSQRDRSLINRILLPSDEPAIFQLYRDCVVFGNETGVASLWSSDNLTLAKTWILADKIGDEEATNLTIDRIGARDMPAPGFVVVNYSYANTIKFSALRRIYVDLYIHQIPPEDFIDELEAFEGEFRADLGFGWTRLL